MLEESCRATDVFSKSMEAIRRHAISTAGIVRIAAVPTATVTLLPTVIEIFRKTHPDVRIEISEVGTAAVRRRVWRDEADIGILSARPGDVDEGDLISSDDLGIVCAQGGPVHSAHQAKEGYSDWSLLNHEPLIANPLCLLVDDPLIETLMANSTLEARNTTAILSFVRRGFDANILPFDAVRSQSDGVEFFVPSNPLSRRELRKIRQHNSYQSAPAEVYWALLTGL